jgi:hypothetical protein
MQNESTEKNLKLLFSKKEGAAALGISPRKVDLLISAKLIRPTRIGRRCMLHRKEIERLARQGAA